MNDKLARILLCACLSATAGVGVAGASAQETAPDPDPTGQRTLTIADDIGIREVSDPQVSPDGEWVTYVVTSRDLKEDESASRIWMVPGAGGKAVPMTAEGSSASRPRWSPDGKYLSFLSARDEGKTQVWTLYRQGGDAVQLTDTAQGVQAHEWSPGGDRLLLVLRDPKPEEIEEQQKRKKKEKVKDKTPKPWVVDRVQFKRDYVGYLDRRRTHLYVLDVTSKALTQITSGDFDDSQPAWSPDGKLVAFTSNRSEEPDRNYNTDIWLVAADNPDKGGTLRQLTTNPGQDGEPSWSPDGKTIAHVSVTSTHAIVYATPHLAVVSTSGGEARVLTRELDRQVISPRFSRDGRSILFVIEEGGEQTLARLPAAGGAVKRLISGPDTVRDYSLGQGSTIAALISRPHLPGEVFLLEGGRLEQLSHVNDQLLAKVRLGAVEKVRFDSKDGTQIEAFVVKPPSFDPSFRYPTLLRIHGGPQSQYDHGFHFQAQLFAANGYLVVLPNPRGSWGYGQDFSMAIWQSWGERDFEDVMASVDYLIAEGHADPDRRGVGGWSYGGMLTNHVITKTDRFKGAITGASATLYVVNYGHDHYQRWWEYELGLPWKPESRKLWEKLSPFNDVEKIVTPTLIVGGENDWNVPIVNSEQLYQALVRLGRTARLVVYPGQFHGIGKPSYRKDLLERYLAWYGKYVKGDPAAR